MSFLGHRRRLDLTALGTLVLGLPGVALGFVVLTVLLSFLPPEHVARWTTIALWGWLLSGALAFVRPAETLLARLVHRLRRPTPAEKLRLNFAWCEVAAAAGVSPSTYSLWVQRSGGVNAFATAGHIVGVTEWALLTQSHRHLAAILAHEFGHHRGGHTWVGTLLWWYSMPTRLVLRVVRLVLALISAVVPLVGCLLSLALLALVSAGVVAIARGGSPEWLLLVLIPALSAWASRRSELRADRAAAQLGYGPALSEVFRGWLVYEEQHRQRLGVVRTLMRTHPPTPRRIRALERYQRRRVPANGPHASLSGSTVDG